MNQLFYNIAGGVVHKIRRKKRTAISEKTVHGRREILSKINKADRNWFYFNFSLESSSFIFNNFKRKNLGLPLKDETEQFVICLVLPECLSVKNCILPSDSEANRDGADAEFPFPSFISFSASFKNSSLWEKVGKLSSFCWSVCIHYCSEI